MKLTLVCICSCSYILQTCYWFSYCKLDIPVEKLGFNVLYTVQKLVFGGEMFLCMWENISRVWKSLLTFGTLCTVHCTVAKPGLQLQRLQQVFSSVRIWFWYRLSSIQWHPCEGRVWHTNNLFCVWQGHFSN